MPTTTTDHSLRNTLLFLSIFILAFFPSAFHLLLKPFLFPLEYLGAEFSPKKLELPICDCCPRTDCPSSSTTPSTTSSSAISDTMSSTWTQKTLTLRPQSRGCHLITDEILKAVPEISKYKVGMMQVFIQHTSCALSLNENCDPDVRSDMNNALSRLAPEDPQGKLYEHADEGLDDMPAHIKSSLVGASVTVPITDGRLALGMWQGVWYLEFRKARMERRVVVTVQGEMKK